MNVEANRETFKASLSGCLCAICITLFAIWFSSLFPADKFVVVLCGLNEEHYALIVNGTSREIVPIRLSAEDKK